MAIRKTAKWYRQQSGSSKKKRYTDAQRAAYWKKQYLACKRHLIANENERYRRSR